MVIWLMGISGSGKSTLGIKVKEYYDKNNIKAFIIDGDIVREFFDFDLGYTKNDRIENIKRVILSAFFLEKNGIVVIVCNISPFENLRNFARRKFQDYNEIFLSKNIEVAKKNDVKKVYEKNIDSTPIVGVDIFFEEPLNSNLKIDIDAESIDESYQKIINYIESKNNDS